MAIFPGDTAQLFPDEESIEEAPSELGTLPVGGGGMGGDIQQTPLKMMDHPVPGNSLTVAPGNAEWEQPTELTNMEDIADYFFERMTEPKNQRNILRLLDAGLPATIIAGSIAQYAASKSKINMDGALNSIPSLVLIMQGLGDLAGINVVLQPPDTDKGLDPEPIKKMFQKKVKARKEAVEPQEIKTSLLARPKKETADTLPGVQKELPMKTETPLPTLAPKEKV